MTDGITSAVSQEPAANGQEPELQEGQTFDAEYVKTLRAEAAKYRTELKSLKAADEHRQREAAMADEQRMKEQAKWQELAEKRQAERDALAAERESLVGKFDAYATAVTSILDNQKKGLPKHIVALLDKLDPVEQLQYIADNADELRPQAATPGTPQSPKRQPSTQPAPSGTPLRL